MPLFSAKATAARCGAALLVFSGTTGAMAQLSQQPIASTGTQAAGAPSGVRVSSLSAPAVTGNGRADKAQVTAMVTKILQLQQKPTPADAADALALAICHCWRAPMIARMAKAEQMAAEQRRTYQAKLKAAR